MSRHAYALSPKLSAAAEGEHWCSCIKWGLWNWVAGAEISTVPESLFLTLPISENLTLEDPPVMGRIWSFTGEA